MRPSAFSQAVLMKNGTWRTTTYKYPSGGDKQFLRLLLLGLPDEKLRKIIFRFHVYEVFSLLCFFIMTESMLALEIIREPVVPSAS